MGSLLRLFFFLSFLPSILPPNNLNLNHGSLKHFLSSLLPSTSTSSAVNMPDTELIQPLRRPYFAVVVVPDNKAEDYKTTCFWNKAGCECFKARDILCNENGHGQWSIVSQYAAIVGIFKPQAYVCNTDGTLWKNSHGHPILKKGKFRDDSTSVRNRMWNYMVSLRRFALIDPTTFVFVNSNIGRQSADVES